MRALTSSAVAGVVLLGTAALSSAQVAGSVVPVARLVSLNSGSILGAVRDERGIPIQGAMVSALGATTAVAVTDRSGRFEFTTLSPGSYMVRAHLVGYTAPRPQLVEVRPSARTTKYIDLRRIDAPAPILAAGMGVPAASGKADKPETPAATDGTSADSGEMAWWLSHARRGVLKQTTFPGLIAGSTTRPFDFSTRPSYSPIQLVSSFIADSPFSGQVNLLTSGSFQAPRDLFTESSLSRGVAFISLSAPAGSRADWTVRGALTQADISSWIVSASYATRGPDQHQYGAGFSYSTQRYDGGNPLALRQLTDGSRNVGQMYGFETMPLSPTATITYGGRWAEYDYLERSTLLSPVVELKLKTPDELRLTARLSQRALAPGAEEFLPPTDSGVWLPPQRTFSGLQADEMLVAERTIHASVDVERDLGSALTIGARAFHQNVRDQLMTLFGVELPEQPVATLGHYFAGSTGDAKAVGGSMRVEARFSSRVRGAVAYSVANARLHPFSYTRYLVPASDPARPNTSDRVQDISTTLETRVPETATRVILMYRLGNGFLRPSETAEGILATRRGVDSRFDFQVRQSLPFMGFLPTTKWEMLVAVRNFFHETATDQSIYDELLVVHPPKRIVGGLTMMF